MLYQGTSAFQEVEVVRTVPFGSLLITDGLMQSSEHDEYVYHAIVGASRAHRAWES